MSSRIDLTGKKFGRLLVKQYIGDSRWLCECICGNTKNIYSFCLVSGDTKSCGCYTREIEQSNNIVGQQFGRLVVKARTKGKWLCECVCGNTTSTRGYELKSGGTKSCGCLSRELFTYFKHGKRHTPEYEIWKSMRQRCENPNNKAYKNYGARGITVCVRWGVFESFYEDMGPRPSTKHTIERKDNNKGYDPDNCIWAESKVQSRNQRSNLRFIYNGRDFCLGEICELEDVSYMHVYERLRRGKTLEQALSEVKVLNKKYVTRPRKKESK